MVVSMCRKHILTVERIQQYGRKTERSRGQREGGVWVASRGETGPVFMFK